jgi:tetratricopeptide (TPR) repeat protein
MHSPNRILSFSIIIFAFLATSQCSSKSSDELVQEGIKHSEKGAYDKSFDSFLKATKLDPKNMNAFYGLGGIYNYRNEYEKAIQAFKTVIKLDPTYFNARYSLGFTYEKIGKQKLAEIEYERYNSLKKRFESMLTKE